MKNEREVAGLRCRQVLELLPAVLDGSLARETRERVEAHLAGCGACARFGGEYAAAVEALRAALGLPPATPRSRAEREALMDAIVARVEEGGEG